MLEETKIAITTYEKAIWPNLRIMEHFPEKLILLAGDLRKEEVPR